MSRVLVISDTQAPGHHPDAIEFITHVNSVMKCDTVVHIGDEIDNHKLSIKHLASPNGMSAELEYHQALEFMKKLYAKFPVVHVCISNHLIRPWKKAEHAGIPEVFLKDYKTALEAPDGWIWRDRWEIDGVLYQHGMEYSGQLGHKKAALDNRKSTVIGHLCAFAGINYSVNYEMLPIWGMNVGCLVDPEHQFFKYGKYKGTKPTIGMGVVLNGVPLYIPMKLDTRGRWTGQL